VLTKACQSAKIAEGAFRFELEVSGENLAGGVVLKADESELEPSCFEPVVAASVGENHHATERALAAGAIER
jgi:hypothetical protein